MLPITGSGSVAQATAAAIEAETAIGLQSGATGEMLVEHREGPGGPLTRVDLDIDRTEAIGRLVIRNASPPAAPGSCCPGRNARRSLASDPRSQLQGPLT